MITKQARWVAVVALGATLCAIVGADVQAQTLGHHPAVLVKRAPPTIDPNTFIVAHPAQLTLKSGHAGHEHPALTARREAAAAGIDTNTFLVQPPASTTWTFEAAAPTLLAVTGTR
jgi:hypothetical protein